MKLVRSFGRNLHIKNDTVYFLFFNQNLVLESTQNIAIFLRCLTIRDFPGFWSLEATY